MKREYFFIVLFFTITAAAFYLFYQIVIPFFAPIVWAAVFAIMFHPLYDKLLTKVNSRGLSSLIVTALIVVLLLGPVTYLFIALVQEAIVAVGKINEMYKAGELQELLTFEVAFVQGMQERLSEYFDIEKINLDEIIRDAINRVSGALVGQTTWLVANGTKAVFYFFLMIFTLYYFIKDGSSIISKLKRLVPLPPDQVNVTFAQLRDVIQATMYGGLVVALVQGILGGVLFAILGIASPVFWGAIMAFLSILPLVGAFIVYVPAGIILMLGGSYVKGIIVILIGTLVISQSDNLIRPYLISGRTAMHPLLLFFAIMGGIAVFGLLGIVLGPIIAAIFMTLLKIFEFSLHPESATATPGDVEEAEA